MYWKLFLLAVFSLGTFTATPLVAQEKMSRDEKRKWKKTAKQFARNPQSLQALMDEQEQMRAENQQMNAEINQMRATVANKDQQITNYEAQIATLNQRLVEAQNVPPPPPPQDEPLVTDQLVMGIVYRVQIGAFEKNKMDDNLVTNDNLKLEEGGDLQKVVVGQFRTYAKAKTLRDNLRKMGMKGAWIVAYSDGPRVEVEEAMRLSGEKS